MPDPVPPEFSRPIGLDALREGGGAELSAEATPAEREALARRFKLPAVRRLAVSADLRPWGPGGWRVAGRIAAGFVQSCVVTLEPVETDIEERFERFFAPEARLAEAGELLDEDARDELEALGAAIDVGEIASEAAALAIDPYPRREGAVFDGRLVGPRGSAPLTDDAAKPFARLAALRPRSEG